MDSLISSASSTFYNTVGFGMGSLIDFVVEQALVVLGFGLAMLEAALPVILVIGVISALLYIFYRTLRWLHWIN